MLDMPQNGLQNRRAADQALSHGQPTFIDIDYLLSAARRQLVPVAICALIGLLLGLAYVSLATPIYTATATVIYDTNPSKVVSEITQETPLGGNQIDALMDSQVQLVSSGSIGLKVVDQLDLTNNEAFMPSSASVSGQVRSTIRTLLNPTRWFGEPRSEAGAAQDRRQTAVKILSRSLTIRRVGATYVLTISYSSPNQQLSVDIANAVADAYVNNGLASRMEASQRAGSWLESRIQSLRQQSLKADLAVQEFRSERGLLASNGQLISETQLSEISSQLITARAQTTASLARYNSLKTALENNQTDTVVDDALTNPTINALRQRYLVASREDADISARVGRDHAGAQDRRRQMQQYSDQIRQELVRIRDGYQNAYEVNKNQQATLEASLRSAMSMNATNNREQVQLRDLEREANSYRELYETFLRSYQEAIQRETSPFTDARTITVATTPDGASSPRKTLALALATVLGIMGGLSVGAIREFRERFFRTGDQVREELMLPYLGALPLLPLRRSEDPQQEPGAGGIAFKSFTGDEFRKHLGSLYGETLRNVKVNCDALTPQRQMPIIGVTSSLPNEGKSTTATSLALLMVTHGKRVLLIDGDLRRAGLSGDLMNPPVIGLSQVLAGEAPLEAAMLRDESGCLTIIPVGSHRGSGFGNPQIGLVGLGPLLSSLSADYDYAIIDLPPATLGSELKTFEMLTDVFLLVVEWGGVARSFVKRILTTNPTLAGKCIGVVLNKVDLDRMHLYESFGSNDYYADRFSGYYMPPSETDKGGILSRLVRRFS